MGTADTSATTRHPRLAHCQNTGRPEMTDRRWRPDMTESPSTDSGGSLPTICPDGPPVYRENLRSHNAVIQSSLLSIHISQHASRAPSSRPPLSLRK